MSEFVDFLQLLNRKPLPRGEQLKAHYRSPLVKDNVIFIYILKRLTYRYMSI
jgi:hypothetical protein